MTNTWDSFGTPANEIEVVPYQQQWHESFIAESKRIADVCQTQAVIIEHIGSTSIPGLSAKPVLDLMLGLKTLADGDALIKPLERLGYEYYGEFGIPDRYFFVLKYQGRSVVHLHCFVFDSSDWQRHLYFKDYLLDHPEQLKQYEVLKIHLAKQFYNDRENYSKGKNEFIQRIEATRFEP